MMINLNFEHPMEISAKQNDILEFQIDQPSFFVSSETGHSLKSFTPLKQSIPKQLPPGVEEKVLVQQAQE
jgi:hypothetical protein